MKIIKQGDLEKANKIIRLTRRFECTTCGCVFEGDQEDWHYEEGQLGAKETTICPTCNRKVQRVLAMQ